MVDEIHTFPSPPMSRIHTDVEAAKRALRRGLLVAQQSMVRAGRSLPSSSRGDCSGPGLIYGCHVGVPGAPFGSNRPHAIVSMPTDLDPDTGEPGGPGGGGGDDPDEEIPVQPGPDPDDDPGGGDGDGDVIDGYYPGADDSDVEDPDSGEAFGSRSEGPGTPGYVPSGSYEPPGMWGTGSGDRSLPDHTAPPKCPPGTMWDADSGECVELAVAAPFPVIRDLQLLCTLAIVGQVHYLTAAFLIGQMDAECQKRPACQRSAFGKALSTAATNLFSGAFSVNQAVNSICSLTSPR